MLVFGENWFDAWHATVDGSPAKILRAYATFRAVAVPTGKHTVRFWYDSSRYDLGRDVTWASVLYLFLAVGTTALLSRRRKKNIESTEVSDE